MKEMYFKNGTICYSIPSTLRRGFRLRSEAGRFVLVVFEGFVTFYYKSFKITF